MQSELIYRCIFGLDICLPRVRYSTTIPACLTGVLETLPRSGPVGYRRFVACPAGGLAIAARANRYHLADLPEMIIIALAKLPKTPNGKFDRSPLARQHRLP